jgi:outer membrane lipoprotein-sorting protein
LARGTAKADVELNPAVAAWLTAQTNIQSWSADFTQTRKLKSLAQPLKNKGHLWFVAPSQFRWELGHPAQTIAVRTPNEMMVFYPQLKRVERFPLTGQIGAWGDALELLQAGFPRSRAELESHYDVLSQSVSDNVGKLVLAPKSAAARRMMPQIEIDFGTQDHSLRGTELQFADGSSMRNDFNDAELNPKVDETIFAPPIPSDYKVTEPLKQH